MCDFRSERGPRFCATTTTTTARLDTLFASGTGRPSAHFLQITPDGVAIPRGGAAADPHDRPQAFDAYDQTKARHSAAV